MIAYCMRIWLSIYAPEEFKYVLQEEMPNIELSDAQKGTRSTPRVLKSGKRTGEELHLRLHELKTEIPIQPKELFRQFTVSFLIAIQVKGRLVPGLPHDFIVKRLEEH